MTLPMRLRLAFELSNTATSEMRPLITAGPIERNTSERTRTESGGSDCAEAVDAAIARVRAKRFIGRGKSASMIRAGPWAEKQIPRCARDDREEIECPCLLG